VALKFRSGEGLISLVTVAAGVVVVSLRCEASVFGPPSPSEVTPPGVDATGVFDDEPAVAGGTKETADEFSRSAFSELGPASCEGPGLLSGVEVLVDK